MRAVAYAFVAAALLSCVVGEVATAYYSTTPCDERKDDASTGDSFYSVSWQLGCVDYESTSIVYDCNSTGVFSFVYYGSGCRGTPYAVFMEYAAGCAQLNMTSNQYYGAYVTLVCGGSMETMVSTEYIATEIFMEANCAGSARSVGFLKKDVCVATYPAVDKRGYSYITTGNNNVTQHYCADAACTKSCTEQPYDMPVGCTSFGSASTNLQVNADVSL